MRSKEESTKKRKNRYTNNEVADLDYDVLNRGFSVVSFGKQRQTTNAEQQILEITRYREAKTQSTGMIDYREANFALLDPRSWKTA